MELHSCCLPPPCSSAETDPGSRVAGALLAGRPRDLAGKRAHPLTPGDGCTRNLQAQPRDRLSGPPSTPLTWGSEPGLPPRLPPRISNTPCKRLCELALGELEKEGRPAADTHSPLCLKSQQARPRWPPQVGGASLRLLAASPAGECSSHCSLPHSQQLREQAANTTAHGLPPQSRWDRPSVDHLGRQHRLPP